MGPNSGYSPVGEYNSISRFPHALWRERWMFLKMVPCLLSTSFTVHLPVNKVGNFSLFVHIHYELTNFIFNFPCLCCTLIYTIIQLLTTFYQGLNNLDYALTKFTRKPTITTGFFFLSISHSILRVIKISTMLDYLFW